ncbi:MAG: hypothetical protein HUJ51_03185 [Eggerthellaceae bacterium]|nr:hypothetical protein [Eggerthellaceae bacterium]
MIPIQVRHNTPDARRLTEIRFISYEGGGISYNLPYCKDVPIERTIHDWNMLTVWPADTRKSIKINRELYRPLTGTLVPPSILRTRLRLSKISLLMSMALGIFRSAIASEETSSKTSQRSLRWRYDR